jgi:hypothetical protein
MLKYLLCMVILFGAGTANAADVAGLGWGGEFLLAQDSGSETKSANISKSPASLGLQLEFASLQAGADGAKAEASSSFSGQLVVLKPQNIKIPTITLSLKGTIIKSLGSTARVDIIIGDLRKTYEWKVEQILSGSFQDTLSATVGDKLMSAPMPVSVTAWVTKTPGGGAVLVTVDKLDITIAEANSVASLSPDFAH